MSFFFFANFASVLGCASGHVTGEPDVVVVLDAGSDALEIPERAIKVMTYNVERLFDPVCDSGNCSPGSYEALPDEGRFFAHARRLALGITAMDADLVFLQEVENQNGIDAMQSEFEIPYPIAVIGEKGTPASVDVAILARGELIDVVRHRQENIPLPFGGETTFAREFLEVHLDIQGSRVIAFAAHFKSKANDDPDRRLAEAQAAFRIVKGVAAQNPDALVVMGGDLNDTPFSAPLAALTSDGTLDRVASELGDGAATYFFRSPVAIDHLFVATTTAGDFVEGSAAVFGFPDGYYGSDHATLTGYFSLPPLDVNDEKGR